MSDFSDLCSSYGLSPGDPEAIDKLIHLMHEDEDDEEDASWYFDNREGFEWVDTEDDDD
jgi:hypothetical protein